VDTINWAGVEKGIKILVTAESGEGKKEVRLASPEFKNRWRQVQEQRKPFESATN
jgi:hypothetical protein